MGVEDSGPERYTAAILCLNTLKIITWATVTSEMFLQCLFLEVAILQYYIYNVSNHTHYVIYFGAVACFMTTYGQFYLCSTCIQ